MPRPSRTNPKTAASVATSANHRTLGLDWFGLTLGSMLAALVIMMLVARFGLTNFQAHQRQAFHAQQVSAVADLLTKYTATTNGMLPPGVDHFPRQIGLASDGCELNVHGCQATTSACANLTTLLSDPYLTLPAVLKTGNAQRTQLQIQQTGPEQITIQACSADSATQTMTISNLRLFSPEEAARVATASSITR
jgi:hypothetical protein